MNRQEQINTIVNLIAEHLSTDGAYGDPIWSRDYAAQVNADGWTLEADLDGDGRRRVRHEGVVLTSSELDEAWRLATEAAR